MHAYEDEGLRGGRQEHEARGGRGRGGKPAWDSGGGDENRDERHAQPEEEPANDWLSSLRAETAARVPARPARTNAGRDMAPLSGPGPSVVNSDDGAWSPPPSPPRRHRGSGARVIKTGERRQPAAKSPVPVPGRSRQTPVPDVSHTVAEEARASRFGGRKQRGLVEREREGKGLSADVVASLEADANALRDVLLTRLLRVYFVDWRAQADITAMSCPHR